MCIELWIKLDLPVLVMRHLLGVFMVNMHIALDLHLSVLYSLLVNSIYLPCML